MNEISHIEKAIEYLQSLKKQNAVVDKIEIEYGWRYATPEDTTYCERAKTRVPDGSFVMRVYGEKNCS